MGVEVPFDVDEKFFEWDVYHDEMQIEVYLKDWYHLCIPAGCSMEVRIPTSITLQDIMFKCEYTHLLKDEFVTRRVYFHGDPDNVGWV